MIRHAVVRDEDVASAVAVEIDCDNPEPGSDRRGDPALLGHVGERSVPVVSIEDVAGRRVVSRRGAVVEPAGSIPALEFGGLGPVDVVGDVEIGIAVGVAAGLEPTHQERVIEQ